MHWVIQFFIRHRNISSLLLTIFLSIFMITAPRPQQAKISRLLTFSVFYPFQVTIAQANRIRDTFRENEVLRRKVASLNTRLRLMQDAGIENARLRGMLGFKALFEYDVMPVRVVAREPSPLFRSCIINAGRDRELVRFMPVVTGQGVAGKINGVYPHLSQVQLLTDPSNRTSVMTRRNRVVGILETENGKSFFVRYRSHAPIAVDDTVITSGLGGIYPKGLYVGEIVTVTDDPDPLFKKAWIGPAGNFEDLEEVFVLRLSPQWRAFLSDLDSARQEEQ